MTNLMMEEKKTQLFDYLNNLLSKHVYPYSNQTTGHYQAKELHEKISLSFEKMIDEYEQNGDEELIEETSYEICESIDEDISNFFFEKCDDSFYFIDFRIFQSQVSAKIKNIIIS